MENIKEKPEIIEVINNIINAGGIAEVKIEKSGITVVEILRKVRTKSNR